MIAPRTRTWVEISGSALTSNVKAFRRRLGSGTALMATVKANAYGHGLIQTAQIADRGGADWFGVDSVDEGIALRHTGIRKPILVLGYTLHARLKECIKHGLSFVIYNLETARQLKRLELSGRKGSVAKVHLKIETGTTRQGVEGEELRALCRLLKSLPGVRIEGASTHYANIEDTTDHAYFESQLVRFQSALQLLQEEGIDPPWKHTACSAASVLFPQTYFTLARIGISMYGLWSSKETQAVAQRSSSDALVNLRPVLTWKTVVAQVKSVRQGTAIGYGLTEKAARDSRIAVLPIGYWDGFDRGLSSVGQVLVHGRRCKVMGRICMNMCMVDVTDVPNVRVEDEVVLIGTQGTEEISAQEVAARLGTIHYEVVTRINPTVPRIVKR